MYQIWAWLDKTQKAFFNAHFPSVIHNFFHSGAGFSRVFAQFAAATFSPDPLPIELEPR